MKNYLHQYIRLAIPVLVVAGFLVLALPEMEGVKRIDKSSPLLGSAIIQWDFNGDGQFDTDSVIRRGQDGGLSAGEINIPIVQNGTTTVHEFGTGFGSWGIFKESGTILLQTLHRNRSNGETPFRFLWILAEFQLPPSGSLTGESPLGPIAGQAYIATFATVEDVVNKNPSLSANVNIRGIGNITLKKGVLGNGPLP